MLLPAASVVGVKLTPSRQRNAVSEGMALGLLMCDRESLPFDKVMVDLAFEASWRGWAYRHQFSQVDADIRNGSDGVWVMTRASSTKQSYNFYWDRSGPSLQIYARPQWAGEPLDEEAVAASIDGDVPAEGWRALAGDFLATFGR